MNNTVYVKAVNQRTAAHWAMEVIQRAYVFKTGLNNAEALIGLATNEDRWVGVYKHPTKYEWVILMSEGIMNNSNNFKAMLMSIAGEDEWIKNSCSFVGIIREAEKLRNNWDWQDIEESRLPEVSDEDLLDIVQLEIVSDPAEELFKQLPEAIREAVYNRLPTEGALPGVTSRGETLEEVADFCIRVAAEQAARAEADRLWDAWLADNPPEPPPVRRRPRKSEGAKKDPRRKVN